MLLLSYTIIDRPLHFIIVSNFHYFIPQLVLVPWCFVTLTLIHDRWVLSQPFKPRVRCQKRLSWFNLAAGN